MTQLEILEAGNALGAWLNSQQLDTANGSVVMLDQVAFGLCMMANDRDHLEDIIDASCHSLRVRARQYWEKLK